MAPKKMYSWPITKSVQLIIFNSASMHRTPPWPLSGNNRLHKCAELIINHFVVEVGMLFVWCVPLWFYSIGLLAS